MKTWQWILLIVNAAAFAAFGIDKLLAKRGMRRIPEKVLFLLAALGGTPGAIAGMRLFHHKTKHRSFTLGLPAILLFQISLVAALFFWYHKGRG
ncbi:MAG TPA: DUF1294 domain-containing protein [Candidatus Acidoferrum sp.]|nr:DUF1294 domain-containing protein [Candidatus Acidoferrum sp.]